ncbi:apolipoprotein N-acyltransferase [Noviherbaspirillum sp. CPCC 100848]|uniref:Apolipoprotein N-acyltransferase n=1 Tax=Noviherbaspirillum album TaxID=3080276 RepID=A0ABU6JEW2_9BURK|nr:apolipoprotein N-acyltransferase [Noviherbaspirillum sp. CPCC 100848]MEC4722210.1 apolipoprotein N-acyltransferase [Noviherbaspirillum sp. CPCC 100848]
MIHANAIQQCVKRQGACINKIKGLSLVRGSTYAFLAGMLAVLGYAPFYAFPVPVLALAVLFAVVARQESMRAAGLVGFVFGMGTFGTGVSWVYVSLHEYGGLNTAAAVVITTLFCAYLALFIAFASVLGWLVRHRSQAVYFFVMPSIWVASELLRGTLFTGFPWLAVGYSQVPDSPLVGFAPIVGVYGLSAIVAASGSMLAYAFLSPASARARLSLLAILCAIWGGGALLQLIAWTTPSGAPIPVSLVQGNIAQDLKWQPEQLEYTLNAYRSLIEQSTGKLIVTPETALPLYADQIPAAYRQHLADFARRRQADIIVGVVERTTGKTNGRYYNSAISTGVSAVQTYRKRHLVPFGEYIPAKPILGGLLKVLQIPFSDMSAGDPAPSVLSLAGEKVAINICFEDVFGEELASALPQSSLLVNMSNLAWFGDSLAIPQHLQIAQMRSLETGRYMLRATNTGATAVIDERGRVVRQAPAHKASIVNAMAHGRAGRTPFVRFGNTPAHLFAATGLLGALALVVVKWHHRIKRAVPRCTAARSSDPGS